MVFQEVGKTSSRGVGGGILKERKRLFNFF